MRDEKQAADQAQYVDAVRQIEILQITGHSPPNPPRIFSSSLKHDPEKWKPLSRIMR
jgi:hypothetical protein